MKIEPNLVVEIDTYPERLAPGECVDHVSQMIARTMRLPLFEATSKACDVRGVVAERVEVDETGLKWTIHLRPRLRWSDGMPLQSEDVVLALRALTSRERSRSWGASVLARRRGGELDVEILCPNSLRVRLQKPLAMFPVMLTNDCFSPIRAGGRPEITLSPYVFSHELPMRRGFVFGATRASRRDTPDRIIFLRTESPDQGVRLYERGYISVTNPTSVPPDLFCSARNRDDFVAADISIVAQLQLNPDRYPLTSSKQFRRAVCKAIDRPAIARELEGVVVPLRRYSELWRETAEQAVTSVPANDGVRKGIRRSRSDPMTITFADFVPNGYVVKRIAADVGAALGIDVLVEAVDFQSYVRRVRNGSYDVLYTLICAPFEDPSSLLSLFRRDGDLARATGFVDPFFDATLDDAVAISDVPRRFAAYDRANDILLSTLPVIPLFRHRSMMLRRPLLSEFGTPRNGLLAFEAYRDRSDRRPWIPATGRYDAAPCPSRTEAMS